MKRFVQNRKPSHTIDIVVEFNQCWDDIAASAVEHPKNVKKKYLWSDDELTAYNDLIETIIGIIRSHKFEILQSYQSKRSYSYYIDFLPTSGDEVIEIRFRIADHARRELSDEGIVTTDNAPIIKSFTLGSKKYPNMIDIYKAVKHICDDLAKGDYYTLSIY